MAEEFLHGVAAGDPTSDGAVLQTRVSGVDGDVSLRWSVSDDDTGDLVAEGETVATADRDHTVRVTVTGLPDGQRYRYRFTTPGGARVARGSLPHPAGRPGPPALRGGVLRQVQLGLLQRLRPSGRARRPRLRVLRRRLHLRSFPDASRVADAGCRHRPPDRIRWRSAARWTSTGAGIASTAATRI